MSRSMRASERGTGSALAPSDDSSARYPSSGGSVDFALHTARVKVVLPDLIEIVGGDPKRVMSFSDFDAGGLGVRTAGREKGVVHRYDVLGHYAQLAAEGRFSIPVTGLFALEYWKAAARLSIGGHYHGKLVLTMSPSTAERTSMRQIQYRRYGGPDVMQLAEVALPEPGRGQIRVRVKAAGCNPADWKVRAGFLRFVSGWQFPRVMGHDFAGIVDAVGPGASRFKVGDDVFGIRGIRPAGAFADRRE